MPYTKQSQISCLHLLVDFATVEGDRIVIRLPETTTHTSPERLQELLTGAKEGLDTLHQAIWFAGLR